MRARKPKVRSQNEIDLVYQFGPGVSRLCGCSPNDTGRCKAPILGANWTNKDWTNILTNLKPGGGKHADCDLGPPLTLEEENIKRRQINESYAATVFELSDLRAQEPVYTAYLKSRSDKARRGGRKTQENRRKNAKQWREDIRTYYSDVKNTPREWKGDRATANHLCALSFWTVRTVPGFEAVRKFLAKFPPMHFPRLIP